MTHDEMIAVITAHKEGKQIQCRERGGIIWQFCPPSWNFADFEYRVKQEEPKKAIVHAWGSKRGCITFYIAGSELEKHSSENPSMWFRIPKMDREITLTEGVEL